MAAAGEEVIVAEVALAVGALTTPQLLLLLQLKTPVSFPHSVGRSRVVVLVTNFASSFFNFSSYSVILSLIRESSFMTGSSEIITFPVFK